MATRIFFNGHEYSSAADMPADVRQQYDQVLASLEDDNRNGLPDVFESSGTKNVIAFRQSQVSVNGQPLLAGENLPASLRRLIELTLSRALETHAPKAHHDPTTGLTASHTASSESTSSCTWPMGERPTPDLDERFRLLGMLDRVAWVLGRVLQLMVLAAAAVALVGGIWIIQNLDAGTRAQGGAFYLGAGIVLLEGWLLNTYFSLRRRE